MRLLAILAAVFFVIAGEAFAALPRNSVGSAQVKPDSLRGVDIDEGTLGPVPQSTNASKLQGKAASVFQLRVTGACPEGEAIFAVTVDGTVQCLAVAGGPVSWNDLEDVPTFATVAFSGDYADLTGTPALATIAVTGAWDDLIGIPADLADGDDGQSYTAGAGLSLVGNQFSIAGSGVTAAMLGPNSVVGGFGGDVQDGSITADDIGIDAVGPSELATNGVVGGLGGDLQDNSITADDIGSNAVAASELADNAVDFAAMLDDAVGNAEMRDNAIQSAELANGAVVGGLGGDVLDNSITADDLAVDTWNLTGNTGINPGNQYLGTTDAQPLQLRTGGVNRLVISGTGAVAVSGSLSVAGDLSIGGGTNITGHRSATAVLDFNVPAQSCEDLTVTVVASVGDTVAVGSPPLPAGLSVSGFVQSTDTVAVRLCNVTGAAINPFLSTYRVDVWSH